MKTLQVLSFLLLFIFSSLASQAQDPPRYVIQLATYSSWDDFVKDERLKAMSTDQVWAHKVGNTVKAYKLRYNGEYEEYITFYNLDRLNQELKWAREVFKDAFRRSDVDRYNSGLKMAWNILNDYKEKGILPEEYTAKGGRIDTSPASNENYKIQLGAFKNQKSADHIAKHYGFSDTEKRMADQLLSHDFKKINDVVCRRYFFGDFDSKSAAMAKKKAMEKKANRKLLLVKNE